MVIAEARRAYPDLGPDYSSMISERAFDRLTAAITEAELGGAKVLRHPAPSDRARRILPPVVVIDAPQESLLMREEIFGPVLPVIGYDSLGDALDWINSHPHPLALYVFTEDNREQSHVLDHTQSGGVTVNGTLLHIAQEGLPFGGVGASGWGAYHGKAGFERFTHQRAVFRTGFSTPPTARAPVRQARPETIAIPDALIVRHGPCAPNSSRNALRGSATALLGLPNTIVLRVPGHRPPSSGVRGLLGLPGAARDTHAPASWSARRTKSCRAPAAGSAGHAWTARRRCRGGAIAIAISGRGRRPQIGPHRRAALRGLAFRHCERVLAERAVSDDPGVDDEGRGAAGPRRDTSALSVGFLRQPEGASIFFTSSHVMSKRVSR